MCPVPIIASRLFRAMKMKISIVPHVPSYLIDGKSCETENTLNQGLSMNSICVLIKLKCDYILYGAAHARYFNVKCYLNSDSCSKSLSESHFLSIISAASTNNYCMSSMVICQFFIEMAFACLSLPLSLSLLSASSFLSNSCDYGFISCFLCLQHATQLGNCRHVGTRSVYPVKWVQTGYAGF